MLANEYNVINGAESFFIKGNTTGILLIHGFVGTPQSVQYIGEKFGEYGYTVFAPRLKGHGTDYHDLNCVTYQEWIDECEVAYKSLRKVCEEVYIVGQSMGGTLSLLLASKLTDVNGVITINAAIDVPGYAKFIHAEAPRYIQEGTPDIKDKTAKEITYEQVPLYSIKQLLSLIETTKTALSSVNCPLLLIKSTVDHVVPPTSTNYIYNNTASSLKTITTLQNSYHVASMDYDKDQIISDSIEFIKENGNN